MRSSAARAEHLENSDAPNFDAFARELSDVCRKHGIGLAGTPVPFVMEADDYRFDYSIGPDDVLVLGSAKP